MSINLIPQEGLTFSDVLMIPKYSNVTSRDNTSIKVQLSKNIIAKYPVIPANMQSIIGKESLEKFVENGCVSFIHRFCPIRDQLTIFSQLFKKFGKNVVDLVGFSVGVKKEDVENVDLILKTFPNLKLLCVDIAHADSKLGCSMTEFVSKNYPEVFLVAGNVATSEGAKNLWKYGANAVKVGIGSSGICSTRLKTGVGVPQLTAISNVWLAKKEMEQLLKKQLFVISDGGATEIGDLGKALCFSDLVMTGRFFAGTMEAPGEIVVRGGEKYKKYVGSSTHKSSRKEGVEGLVKIDGTIDDVLTEIREGIQSCLSYNGVDNLVDLKINPQFIKLSGAAQVETTIRGVLI